MTLDVVAVERFTAGRMGRDDPNTQHELDVAMAAVRHYCGWHILPVRQETLFLDGPGGKLLTLPTLKVVSIEGIAECGEALDLGDFTWSASGKVAKRPGIAVQPDPMVAPLAWTSEFRGIEVTFTHGFESALDLENVILTAVDRGLSSSTSNTIKSVGPFHYNIAAGAEAGPSFTEQEVSVLARYRLEKPA